MISKEFMSYVAEPDNTFKFRTTYHVIKCSVTAQMTLILTLKQIAVYIKEPFKRAARNRVSVQAYL